MGSKFYIKSKSVLEKFLQSGLEFTKEWVVDTVPFRESDKADELTDIIIDLNVLEALTDIIMPIKFDLLAPGNRDVAFIISSDYVVEHTDFANLKVDEQKLLAFIAEMSDDDGHIELSTEEYNEIVALMKKVRNISPAFADTLFYVLNKRLTDKEVDPGVSHLYTILAPCDDIWANFSCEGHITQRHIDGNFMSLEFDTPSIMIDYNDEKLDLLSIIRNTDASNAGKMSELVESIVEGGYNFTLVPLVAFSNKTWNKRLHVKFEPNTNSKLVANNPMEVLRLNEIKAKMLAILTLFCWDIMITINEGDANVE